MQFNPFQGGQFALRYFKSTDYINFFYGGNYQPCFLEEGFKIEVEEI